MINFLALDEAKDINRYLSALRPIVERLGAAGEFVEIAQIFPALFHTLVLICKNGKYYNTPNRLTVIIREICNDVIELARTQISPAELFTAEPEEAAERIKLVVRVLEAFKQTYFEAKARTLETSHPWNFDSHMVFSRLDQFMKRVTQLLDLFDTIIEFNRLEKIEIGGTKVRKSKAIEDFFHLAYSAVQLGQNTKFPN